MGVFDPENVELFIALEIIEEQEQKGYGPFDAIREEVEVAGW